MADEHNDEHGGSSGEGHGGGGHGGGHGGGGHGGGSHEEHEGAPEWLISFADNVALMMGFFVILLAMNMAKPTLGGIGGEGKFPGETNNPVMEDFAIELREVFHHPVDINSTDPREAALVRRLKERRAQGGTSSKITPEGNKQLVQAVRPSNWIQPAGVIFFANTGESLLSEESKTTLAQWARQFKGTTWIMELRGHVSALEAHGDKVRAMRLANERALIAAQELISKGMTWDQLRVVSCGDNEPATGRPADVASHGNNQRVELVQTQEQVQGDVFNNPGNVSGGESGKHE